MKALDERISLKKGSDFFVPPMACEAVVSQSMVEQLLLDAIRARCVNSKMTWTRVMISRWVKRGMMSYGGVLLSTDTYCNE